MLIKVSWGNQSVTVHFIATRSIMSSKIVQTFGRSWKISLKTKIKHLFGLTLVTVLGTLVWVSETSPPVGEMVWHSAPSSTNTGTTSLTLVNTRGRRRRWTSVWLKRSKKQSKNWASRSCWIRRMWMLSTRMRSRSSLTWSRSTTTSPRPGMRLCAANVSERYAE